MIKDPITLHNDAKVKDAIMIMKKNQIGGIPIINKKNDLVGIVTNRDLRFQKDHGVELIDIQKHTNGWKVKLSNNEENV